MLPNPKLLNRTAPKPLLRPHPLQRHRSALHMATTLSALLSLPSVWPNLKSVLPGSKPAAPQKLARLGELSARHPELAPYLMHEMARRARIFMNGVALYRDHPVQRPTEIAPVVWQSGTTRLRDYAPHSLHAPVILVIPSLINRFTILDLQPQHSFLRTLALHGFRPLVVDWDRPDDMEKDFTLADYISQRLIPALQISAPERPVHILGYCMGGVLALALAALCPARTRGLSLLAAPWDFHAGYEQIGQEGSALLEKLGPWLSTGDLLPAEVVQSVFTAFQPLHAFRKFSSFATHDQSGVDAARFVLTEDWLNDGVPLTANVARECFGDWGVRNILAKGEWAIGGTCILPHKIAAPAYAVIPSRDRIVPPESAMPLARALPNATRQTPDMGHVALMASAHAPAKVWRPLIDWLGAH